MINVYGELYAKNALESRLVNLFEDTGDRFMQEGADPGDFELYLVPPGTQDTDIKYDDTLNVCLRPYHVDNKKFKEIAKDLNIPKTLKRTLLPGYASVRKAGEEAFENGLKDPGFHLYTVELTKNYMDDGQIYMFRLLPQAVYSTAQKIFREQIGIDYRLENELAKKMTWQLAGVTKPDFSMGEAIDMGIDGLRKYFDS